VRLIGQAVMVDRLLDCGDVVVIRISETSIAVSRIAVRASLKIGTLLTSVVLVIAVPISIEAAWAILLNRVQRILGGGVGSRESIDISADAINRLLVQNLARRASDAAVLDLIRADIDAVAALTDTCTGNGIDLITATIPIAIDTRVVRNAHQISSASTVEAQRAVQYLRRIQRELVVGRVFTLRLCFSTVELGRWAYRRRHSVVFRLIRILTGVTCRAREADT
jgi:hypothetical protein